jgi:nitroreductase
MTTIQPPTSAAESPVQAAIFSRRSIRRFQPAPIGHDVIEQLLAAAVQAPNHRRTTPWRFFVCADEGPVRTRLAELAEAVALDRAQNPNDPGARERAAAKGAEMRETPVVLFVYAVPGRNEMETRENYGAVCCAVQNILLSAVDVDLAAGWSTGGICQDARLAPIIGADPSWEMVAALYMGRATSEPVPALTRAGWEPHTTWL